MKSEYYEILGSCTASHEELLSTWSFVHEGSMIYGTVISDSNCRGYAIHLPRKSLALELALNREALYSRSLKYFLNDVLQSCIGRYPPLS